MVEKKNRLKQEGDHNVAIQDSEVTVTISIFDEIARFAKQRDFDSVIELMKQVDDFVGTKHPYYPHYKYTPKKFGESYILDHEPLSEKAKEEYPLTYRGRFRLADSNVAGNKSIYDIMDEAYYKQEKVEIDMISLKAWIGDKEVYTPQLEESLDHGTWVMIPQPLPNPLQLKVYIKGDTDIPLIDYVEMNISDMDKEENTIEISNSKQSNAMLLVTMKMPFDDNREPKIEPDVNINIKIRNDYADNVEANRDFLKLIRHTKDAGITFACKNLSKGNDFMVASNFSFNWTIDDTIFEEEYLFIQRLHKLEHFYGVKFKIPERITEVDWDDIEILESIIDDKSITKKLKNLKIDFDNKGTLKTFIDLFEQHGNEVAKLKFTSSGKDGRIELFKAVIPIQKVETIYPALSINDIDRAKGKYELMDEGERIKIILIPGSEDRYETRYFI